MVRLQGRILFLTEDPELIKRQLAGEDLPWDTAHPERNPKLRDDISTDEITPAHICFFFDETLGEFPYTGLKCGNETPIKRGDVKRGGFVCARQRQAARQRLQPRAVALRRDVGRHQAGDRGEHRAHLQAELPEPRRADLDRLRLIDKIRARRRDSAARVHRKAKTRSRARSSSTAACSPSTSRACRARSSCRRSTTKPRPMTIAEKIFARHMLHGTEQGRRRSGEARRHRIRAHRSALQPRIRHADGGDLLRAFSRQRRAGHRSRAPSCSSAIT